MKISGIHWITNYHCNFNCAHCFFETQTEGPLLDPDLVKRVLTDIQQYQKLKWLHFSGGEPLLYDENFNELIRTSRKLYDGAIGISTNAFWAKSSQVAREKVAAIKSLGVDGIAVSCDAFHQEFVSVEFPARAVRAIEAADMKVHSYLIGTLLKEDQKEAGAKNALTRELLRLAKGESEIPVALPENRALGKGGNFVMQRSLQKVEPCSELSCCLGNCSPFNPAMVWIDPYGNVLICYGLKIGNVYERDLSQILADYNPDEHPVTHVLGNETPNRLAYINGDESIAEKYYDSCDACYRLRKKLRKSFPEAIGPEEHFPV